MTWVAGKSGNPNGRPKGTKDRRTLEFDELYDKYSEQYGDPVERMFAMAKDEEVDDGIRAKLLADLAKLKHPTKKAIEIQGEIQQEVLVHLDPGGAAVEAGRDISLGPSRARARQELPPPPPPELDS